MAAPDPAPVGRLLREAEEAHGVYETEELDGVYDQAWAAWYARYLADHGIDTLLGRAISVNDLTRLLGDLFDQYRADGSAAGESWADWTARRLVAAATVGG